MENSSIDFQSCQIYEGIDDLDDITPNDTKLTIVCGITPNEDTY